MTGGGTTAGPGRARSRPGDEEARYRAVLELDPSRPAELDALVAALGDESWRVRTGAVERLGSLSDPGPALPALLERLDAGDTVGGRDAAAAALVRLGGAALGPLVERLATPDAGLRLAVLPVLGAIGDRRAVPAITARLADEDQNVRAAAAEALGRTGGPEAAAALLAALDSDEATLRAAALEALAALRVAPPVYRLARLMGERGLRPAVYRSLAASDDAAALDLLAAGLAERGRLAREAALSAVGQQRARRSLSELAPLARALRALAAREPEVADACGAALAAEDPQVVAGAVVALGFVGEARHAPALARLAAVERHRPLIEEALEAIPRGAELVAELSRVLPQLVPLARITVHGILAAAGSPVALQALVDETGDADPEVQAEAVAALGRLGDPRAVGALGGLLDDDQVALAGVAAAALVRIAQRSEAGARAVLIECRARASTGPSAVLYRILGAVGEGEDLRLIRAGLGDPLVVRRMAAAAAVAGLGRRGLLTGEHVPELIAALGDPAWSVRAATARALAELALANVEGRLGDPGEGEHPLCAGAIDALTGALADPEPPVRAAALEALGACGRPELGPRIAALAVDPAATPLVVLAALHALGQLGQVPAAILELGLSHPDAEVAKEAVGLACRLPGADGLRLLRAAAGSARWDVRHAAARAMADRGDPAIGAELARLAAADPDPLVARAFADAARALAAHAAR